MIKDRWRVVRTNGAVLPFLSRMEPYSTAVYPRYLRKVASDDRSWVLTKPDAAIAGLLVMSGRALFPVFDQLSFDRQRPPSFLAELSLPFYALQGVASDVELLEDTLPKKPAERILYDLMISTRPPPAARCGPAGLVLRSPTRADMDALFQLQAGYEQEEVLRKNVIFDSAVCRLTIEQLVAREHMLLAELDGVIIGKINTSAASPAWYQIGGVYVHPAYRGRGVASCMTAAFTESLLFTGKSVCLFVKRPNIAARAVYRRTGFAVLEDYRISYF